jgi:hypothetical protein
VVFATRRIFAATARADAHRPGSWRHTDPKAPCEGISDKPCRMSQGEPITGPRVEVSFGKGEEK